MTYQRQFKTEGWKVKNRENGVACSRVSSPTVYIEPLVRQKIEFLMGEYSHTEWLGYMVGRISEQADFFVEELSIPPHESVSAGEAVAVPFNIPEGCIGVIHSHHSMGAFHSGTDQAYVDKNFQVSVVVAKKGGELEYDAISYQVTPCDKGSVVNCPVKYVAMEPLFSKEEFLKESKENIDKGKWVYKPTIFWNKKEDDKLPYSGHSEEEVEYLDDRGMPITKKEYDTMMQGIWD